MPTATPATGSVRWSFDGHATFVSQGDAGPGTVPPEAAGFVAGAPLAPLTPYDTFSSAPLLSGNAGETSLLATATWYGRSFDASAVFGAGFVRGSVSNAIYWGEQPLPALDPHVGAQQLPYAVSFPTHAGGDDGTAFAGSVVRGSIASKDGAYVLRGGWFDLAQTDGFVFAQPALQSAVPALAVLPPESLGDGVPALAAWSPSDPVYPLHGIDLHAQHGGASYEAADATLPSLPGTSARILLGSAVFDREGTRISAEALHLWTGGALVPTTVLFGQGSLVATAQGMLPATLLGGQRQTIVGIRGAFRLRPGLDAVVEYGRATYAAQKVAEPGTGKPGNYYHGGLTRALGRTSVALDVYRNEPYYAAAILPYGAPENVWAVAWSWPGQWLKSNYQLVANAPVNIDRQGYRVKLTRGGRVLEVRAAYANFGQIEPISLGNARATGFVDGFFLPQQGAFATLGRQRQYALWSTWHAPGADLVLDYAEDTMRRAAAPPHPEDLVSYDTPQFSVYATRKLGRSALFALGVARYGMRGSFGQADTNVDFAQRVAFAGAQFRESAGLATLVTLRRSTFAGLPSQPGGPAPNFAGTLLVVEQRISR